MSEVSPLFLSWRVLNALPFISPLGNNGGKSGRGATASGIVIDISGAQGGEPGPPQAIALEEKCKPIKSTNKEG